MFTLKDIEMLEVPADTKMIVVRGRPDLDMDTESIKLFLKQVKKALKLPTVFLPDGMDIEVVLNGDLDR
jgi:hypothetical protein